MHSLKNCRNSAWKVAWPSGKVSNGATPLGVVVWERMVQAVLLLLHHDHVVDVCVVVVWDCVAVV